MSRNCRRCAGVQFRYSLCLEYLRPPRARLEVARQQLHRRRAVEADPQETVHGALLNLRPGLPA